SRCRATGTASAVPSSSSRRCRKPCAFSRAPPTRAPSPSPCPRTCRARPSTTRRPSSRSGSGGSGGRGRSRKRCVRRPTSSTASKTAFQDPAVCFVNLNVCELDAFKHAGLALVGDARVGLEALREALAGWHVEPAYRERAARFRTEWDAEVERIYKRGHGPLP